MYYIELDVHKKTIIFRVKDAAGHVHQEGKIGSTRCELDAWIQMLPQPRMMSMEATIFTGWVYASPSVLVVPEPSTEPNMP